MPTQTVLIVDDSRSVRLTLRMVLSDAGYATLDAADGMEAVTILRSSPSRLVVLLDLMMPKLSGIELLELLDTSDEEELTRHAYIFMSADFLDADQAALLRRRNVPAMEKLYNIDELLDQVARAAGRLV